MVVFRRSNSPYWYTTYKRADGTWHTVSTKQTKKDLAEHKEEELRLGHWKQAEMGLAGIQDVPFRIFRERYLAYREHQAQPPLSEKTLALDVRALDLLGDCLPGTFRMQHFSAHQVDVYIAQCRESGLADTTINIRLRHLRTAIYWAMEQDYLAKNPFKKRHRRHVPKLIRVIPDADMRILIEQSSGRWIHDYILAAAYGGMRSSEIRGIHQGDIDWSAKELLITGKYKKARKIPLFPSLEDLFVEILSRPAAEDPRVSKQHNGKVNGMLFYQTFDAAGVSNAFKRMIRQIWSQRTYRLLSGRFTRENGAVLVPGSTFEATSEELRQLPGRVVLVHEARDPRRDRYRFHDLRHTFATNYLRQGGQVEKLQDILGHADISTTMVYKHFTTRDLQEAKDPVRY